MLQPDILVVCEREKIQRTKIFGAPDLVIEILSKSTRRKDMEFPIIYGFDTKIPIGIFGGECQINMRDIREYMEMIGELK